MRKRPGVPSDDPRQAALFQPPHRVPSEPLSRRLLHPVWTENKARLIERYLYFFVLVTKHGTYIDGFAGPQSATTPDAWAAELVLNSQPPWLRHFFLCELEPGPYRQLQELRDTYLREHPKPRRHIHLFAGDFNAHIHTILSSLRPREATFCLLDQRTFECRWSTVAALANYRTEGHKIELFYFLATGWLGRAMAAQSDASVIEAWWGRPDWQLLRGLGGFATAELFAQRFRGELGYASAKPWPIYESESGGRVMYYMIHAADHAEAHKLMNRAYRKAVGPPEPLDQLSLALFDEPPATETLGEGIDDQGPIPPPDEI